MSDESEWPGGGTDAGEMVGTKQRRNPKNTIFCGDIP